MDKILNKKISRSILPLITFLSLPELHSFNFAPQGCSFTDGSARCNFRQWTPPLLHDSFGPEPLYRLTLYNLNGTIQARAFSGLNGSLTEKDTNIYLYCYNGRTKLSRDIFTPNLHWVKELRIWECHLENGLPTRLLENLISLKKLLMYKGGIEGSVAPDIFVGLVNLDFVQLQSPVQTGSLPSGFFDGLTNLTTINLRHSELSFVPRAWFNGLNSLETIDLAYNNLQELPQRLFDGLKSLTTVYLNGNSWHCSCRLFWLLDWSHITAGAICQSPAAVTNYNIEDAVGLTDCDSSSPIIMSTTMSAATKMELSVSPKVYSFSKTTGLQSSSIAIFKVFPTQHKTGTTHPTATSRLMLLSMATSPQQILTTSEPIAVSVTSTASPMILTTSVAHDSENAMSTENVSTTLSIPSTSWKNYKRGKTVTTKALHMSYFHYSSSSLGQTLYYTTRKTTVCNQKRNNGNKDSNRYTVMMYIIVALLI